ncbi:MAG: alpha/beta hydrolase [Planctomycetota bacterium]
MTLLPPITPIVPIPPTRPAGALALPPAPSLDLRHLRANCVALPEGKQLEALVPAGAPYMCSHAEAPALVLLPGLGMDGLGFIRQLPLGAIAELHLFQMPNEAVPGEQGLGHFARHAEDYIAACGLAQRCKGVVLAGCSMGGAVALAAAIRARVKLRGLILLGSFGNCAHVKWPLRLSGPALAQFIPLKLSRQVARHVVAWTRLFGKIHHGDADWLVSCKLERTREYYRLAALALTTQNQLTAARTLDLPVLVLHGAKDHVLPHRAGVELAQCIPGAQLVTLPDAGHALFFTHYQAVNAAIAEFIERLP